MYHAFDDVLRATPAPLKGLEAPAIRASPFQWLEPSQIRARQWLYGHHYCRGCVSVTVAPGGMGKSLLGIVEGLAMATRRKLLASSVYEPCPFGSGTAKTPSMRYSAGSLRHAGTTQSRPVI
jgi:hypothetical protein